MNGASCPIESSRLKMEFAFINWWCRTTSKAHYPAVKIGRTTTIQVILCSYASRLLGYVKALISLENRDA